LVVELRTVAGLEAVVLKDSPVAGIDLEEVDCSSLAAGDTDSVAHRRAAAAAAAAEDTGWEEADCSNLAAEDTDLVVHHKAAVVEDIGLEVVDLGNPAEGSPAADTVGFAWVAADSNLVEDLADVDLEVDRNLEEEQESDLDRVDSPAVGWGDTTLLGRLLR